MQLAASHSIELIERSFDREERSMQTANDFELRIALTEAIARELLWRALAPTSMSIFGDLDDAIAHQAEQLGVSLDGCQSRALA
jgi:hypothetical protein